MMDWWRKLLMYSSNTCNGLLSGGVRELLPSGDARLAPLAMFVNLFFLSLCCVLLSVYVISCCFHKIQYLTFLLWHKDQVLFYMIFIVLQMIQTRMFFNSMSELLWMSVWELWVNWESDMFYWELWVKWENMSFCSFILSKLFLSVILPHCSLFILLFFHLLNFSIAKLFWLKFFIFPTALFSYSHFVFTSHFVLFHF